MNNKIEIDKENPFINDQFDRAKQIENLYELIKTSTTQFVSCINSEYGRGKTTFFKMFEAYIINQNQNITPIYYDAWENDDFDNPLISLMSCMSKSLEKSKNANYKDFKKSVEDIGANITKILSLGLVDVKELEKILNDTSKRNIVSEYEKAVDMKKSIKDELELIEGGKKVFFIDELDRCKPTFALELLEIIKHYFDTDSYYFILAVDKKQLYSTIRKKYGTTINSEGYLKRFIDFDITMNPINHEKYLISKLKSIFLYPIKMEVGIPILTDLVSSNNLSLREIDKIVYYINLIINKYDEFAADDIQDAHSLEINIFDQVLFVFLIYLKVMHGDLYDSFYNGTIDEKKRSEFFDINFMNEKDKIINNNYLDQFVLESRDAIWFFYENYIKKKCGGKRIEEYLWSSIEEPVARYRSIVNYDELRIKSLKRVQMLSVINPE